MVCCLPAGHCAGQEIDYIGEGRNADRFRRNFSGVPWVEAPRVSWPHTSPRVITLEYLPGVKVPAAPGQSVS